MMRHVAAKMTRNTLHKLIQLLTDALSRVRMRSNAVDAEDGLENLALLENSVAFSLSPSTAVDRRRPRVQRPSTVVDGV